MFGLERKLAEHSENKINVKEIQEEEKLNETDPIEIAKQELYENVLNFEEKAQAIAKKIDPKDIKEFSHEFKAAKTEISTFNIRKFGYNPPKEMVLLHAKIEEYYNQMIRNQIECSYRYQDIMSDLNELQSITSSKDELDEKAKARMKELIDKLNNTNLELPISHPGIYSNKNKPGVKINFSTTDVIDIIKREASKFYSQCESAMHQLFIFIQKLFNDLLSFFDTAKASLRNDAINTMVRNQTR